MPEETASFATIPSPTGAELPAAKKPSPSAVQLAFNMSYYESVYKQALDSADKIVASTKTGEPLDRVEIASTLFQQFCDDQMQVARDKSRIKETMKAIQPFLDVLRQKGLM